MNEQVQDALHQMGSLNVVYEVLQQVVSLINVLAEKNELNSVITHNELQEVVQHVDLLNSSVIDANLQLEILNTNARLIAKAIAGQCTEKDFL